MSHASLTSSLQSQQKVMGPVTLEVPKLVGQENVFLWRRRVKAALKAREVWCAVETSMVGPENDKAVGLLTSSLSDQVLCMLEEENSAFGMWQELTTLYDVRDAGRVILIEDEIYKTKMLPETSAEEHIAKMNKLYSKLAGAGGSLTEEHKARQMLRSLDASKWDTFIQLQTAKSNLTYGKVCSAILLEYERRAALATVGSGSTNDASAMTADTSRVRNRSSNKIRCFFCRKTGHIVKDCRALKSMQAPKQKDDTAAVVKSLGDTPHNGTTDCKDATICFYSQVQGKSVPSTWIVDSGATIHMTPLAHHLTDIYNLDVPRRVRLGDGRIVLAKKAGTIARPGLPKQHALLVPDLTMPLLSVHSLTKGGATCHFAHDSAHVTVGGRKTSINNTGGLYTLPSIQQSLPLACSATAYSKSEKLQNLWHRRLGHPGDYALRRLGYGVSASDVVCEICQRGKQSRLPFGGTNARRSTKPGDKVHVDICGPISPVSVDGYKFVLTITDDFSRLTHVNLLRKKSEASECIMNYVAAVRRQYKWTVRTIRSDRGGEFLDAGLSTKLRSEGIRSELTTPYTPQLNGVAERVNRTLLDRARCMIMQAGLSKVFWTYAILYATVVSNRLPRAHLHGKSPFQVGHNQKPKLDRLKVFGCRAFVSAVGPKDKLRDRADDAVYLGFDTVTVEVTRLCEMALGIRC